MISISKKEYDELIDKVNDLDIPEGYPFPDLEDVENLLTTKEGLAKVLIAKHSPDYEYKKAIEEIIENNVNIEAPMLLSEPVTISQMAFDKIIEMLDDLVLPENYEFPSVDEILSLLTTKEGIAKAMIAAEKSEDSDYRKQVNAIISSNLIIYEATENNEIENSDFSNLKKSERIKKISSRIEQIHFEFPEFLPTDDELESFRFKNLKKNDVDLGFLLWVSEMDSKNNATAPMIHAAKKARAIINEGLSKKKEAIV